MDSMFYDASGMVNLIHVHGAFAMDMYDEEIEERVYYIAVLLVIGQQFERFSLSYEAREARDAALQRIMEQHQRWRRGADVCFPEETN